MRKELEEANRLSKGIEADFYKAQVNEVKSGLNDLNFKMENWGDIVAGGIQTVFGSPGEKGEGGSAIGKIGGAITKSMPGIGVGLWAAEKVMDVIQINKNNRILPITKTIY